MIDERGEIEKRLSEGLCPWCMQPLEKTNEPNTRKCTQCSGKVTDVDTGEQDGNDTRSKS